MDNEKNCAACPVAEGTHKPAEALHQQIAEPQSEALRLAEAAQQAVHDLQDMLRELRVQIGKITAQLSPSVDCSGVWMAHDRMSAAIAAIQSKAPQAVHAAEFAPPNSLPTYDECALRVENTNFLEKRAEGGGYGPEHDSKTATQLHRFIYEYDDADPVRSSWFLHRLELLLNEVRAAPAHPAEGEAK